MDYSAIEKKWSKVDYRFNEFLNLYKNGKVKKDDELKFISSQLKNTFIKAKESYSLIMLEDEKEQLNSDYRLHKRCNDFLEIYNQFKYTHQRS
ncbi:MAG: hypothetical protein K9M80_08570 [Candidatus Marinimicrobia bacterium]|nr:hypothetical protein [Candidatus Neomarinimicrobiota bacterium]